ncbi:DUF3037 domain-containing protein [Citrobacter braakii]|uniref:DUF3037 domain-containing protein n=1 Tax=Citrobacter TaxID=544 RepID=UPI001900AEC9|nr:MULTISPECIES: DUF3037 domain-containing protein [Citrobacter]MBJ9266501.1 DUF3037 domain-containing protein [Citrobacter freundii]MDM3281290.1 DUF3037 domain-containing protein [Citrobacter sp. Ce104]MDM3321489.1 DUF3037 domain-containing protein [Citrobacter sp. Ce006]MDM3363492.1 DUF3037 domain-containing protein [Citrobacter sp. Cb002]MEB1003152.1 DUF3037 domain-containing protein [Citrobacter braakii]
MTTPCLYSIIRYAPYAETEEFANVGVVLCAPKKNIFCYQLTQSNNARIKNFFKDDIIFPHAKDAIGRELSFAQEQAATLHSPERLANFFNYLIARKESVIYFSSSRVVMADDPEALTIKLFNKFVNHSEVTKESRELILTRELRNRFSHYNDLKNALKKETLGGELTRFTIPFVAKQEGDVVCAIKPITFTQDKPEKMMEHCDSWTAKILRAASERVLQLSDVLFTIDPPANPSALEVKAMQEIRKTFTINQISHVDFRDESAIVSFARQAI